MWQPVKLESLPLVLCGPLLRRVEPKGTTVFFALRESAKVTVRVYKSNDSAGAVLQEGTRSTIKLAEHVHVVAVTATMVAGADRLEAGALYEYQAYFGAPADDTESVPETERSLLSPGVFAATEAEAKSTLLYSSAGAPARPSFATPPDDPNHLRLIHASCRKPHGGGADMMNQLDRMIGPALTDPLRRPHQLLLTGDQIYADDVADALLAVIDSNATVLGFKDEALPDGQGTTTLTAEQLLPGRRQKVVETEARFTSEAAKSQLMRFAEYSGMYLLVWSDLLWPEQLPTFADVYPEEAKLVAEFSTWVSSKGLPNPAAAEQKLKWDYDAELAQLEAFRAGLRGLRRAMAHLPTLTMFDDHDVTDDWNMTLGWVQQAVLPDGSHLGRRIVSNALLSYVFFQGWGNTPDRFGVEGDAGAAGRELFARAESWDRTADADFAAIGDLLGLPTGLEAGVPQRPANALTYHYHVDWGHTYQVVALDTRTWRVYLGGPDDPAALLWGDAAMKAMIADPGDLGMDAVTVLIVPAPVIGLPLMEDVVQPMAVKLKNPYYADMESWAGSPPAYHKLLARCLAAGTMQATGTICRRVVLLSGDVHYGFAASVHYRAAKPFHSGTAPITGALAQFVSSSLQNEDAKTAKLHEIGYELGDGVPSRSYAGWANPGGGVLDVGERIVASGGFTSPWQATGTPAVVEVQPSVGVFTTEPEWTIDINYLMHEDPDPSISNRPGDPAAVTDPNVPPADALAQYLAAAKDHGDYLGKWGDGKEVVGHVNFGEITFVWPPRPGPTQDPGTSGSQQPPDQPPRYQAVQTLWWRLPDEKDAAPLTRYVASLDLPSWPQPSPQAPSGTATLSTAATSTSPPPYGGFVLREKDHDGSPPHYDGTDRAAGTQDGYVKQLQQDLLALGFAMVGEATGVFDRWTRWAVRELQSYAKGDYVARDKQPNPRPARYSESLIQAPLPVADRFQGSVSGVVDAATAQTIQTWKSNLWRCPVVIEAWDMQNGVPTAIHPIPASGNRPARPAENIWRHDEVADSGPRMYAVDLSGRYGPPSAPHNPRLNVVGDWQSHTQWGEVWNGPRGVAPFHTWPEAEILPERLLPMPPKGPAPTLSQLLSDRASSNTATAAEGAANLSTYKVVRAVSEVEEYGFFDVYNGYDTAFMSSGPYQWTVGPAVNMSKKGLAGQPEKWPVDKGELWAYLSYLKSADPVTYRQMTADYGLGVSRSWGTDGHALWIASGRKYAASPTMTNENGTALPVPPVVAEFDYFRSWHWAYRIAMAGRAPNHDAWRRRMWDMARQRVYDVLHTPWNVKSPNAFQVADVPTGTGTRAPVIGDVFTSERAVGMLVRWHVLSPGGVTYRGRAGSGVRDALDLARSTASTLSWTTAPTTWTDAHETALVDGLATQAKKQGGELADTLPQVQHWPQWATPTGNKYNYTLPLSVLPANEQNLLDTRGSFRFAAAGLPNGATP